MTRACSHKSRSFRVARLMSASVRKRPKRRVAATSITDGGSVSGDRKLKESTPRLASRRPQPPAMGFDNRAADREAHAHAVGLRRVEGVENVFESLRRQSRTRISHPYEHAARVSLPA